MSETNTQRKTMSAYQQLSGIINALKSEEISLNDALNKIQLKEQRPSRPYCKVTGSGALALYGISKQPMVMYADQWFKFLKVAKSDYIDNYIKYNESRLKFKKKMVKKNDNNDAVEEQLEQLEQVEQVEQLENSETIQES
jgi:hypothetical protein